MGVLDWIKGKQKQKCLYIHDDRTIEDVNLPIENETMEDSRRHRSFFLVHNLLFPINGKMPMVALITGRDALGKDPYGVIKPEDREKYADYKTIAQEALRNRLPLISHEQANKTMSYAISIALVLVFVTLLVVAAIALSGKIDLSGWGRIFSK